MYHALLEQNHIYLPGEETRFGTGVWRAKDIMTPQVEFIAADLPVQDAWALVADRAADTFLVGRADQLAGTVTRKALQVAMDTGHGDERVEAVAEKHFEYLHPDQPLELALERFGTNSDILPVLSRHGRKVEGIITLDTILQFIQKKPEQYLLEKAAVQVQQ